jgi:hypothetical protein
VWIEGRASTFGGPRDEGVGPNEGLALVPTQKQFEAKRHLFL